MDYYLRFFETETDYTNNKDDFKYPTVAYVEETEEVKWMTLQEKYTKEYLTTEALENGVISFNIWKSMGTDMITSISYSTDNGDTWTTTNNTNDKSENLQISINVNTGDKVLWKGRAIQTGFFDVDDWGGVVGSFFSSNCRFNAYGNVMSLLYGDDFDNETNLNNKDGIFAALFYDYTGNETCKIVSAENLILPATTLVDNCYTCMFRGCTALTTAPVLPATTLADYCYNNMFWGCTSLTTAPELPATTLASRCYYYMFYNCTSLTTAPELPATTLASECYTFMFYNCTSLTTAPVLPATTLADYCYQSMFQDCTSLTTAPSILPATTLASYCYYYMFRDCTSLTTAPVLPATTLTIQCYASMFNGCTALTTAPELPATTLAGSCYNGMFYNCTSLTTAPELPATTLGNYCYAHMFYGCTSLTAAPELPATTLAQQCYYGIFSDTNVLPDCSNIDFTSQTVVASGGLQGLFLGTKVTDSDLMRILPINSTTGKYWLPVTTLASRCYYSMFSNCTSLTTAPELPATTLANYCYYQMFYNCTSLTTAPSILPATTLVSNCYSYMFFRCSRLNYIKAMFTTTPSDTYTGRWVDGVAASGTFVKNSAATWTTTGTNGIPSGWTVQTAGE